MDAKLYIYLEGVVKAKTAGDSDKIVLIQMSRKEYDDKLKEEAYEKGYREGHTIGFNTEKFPIK